MLLLHVYSILRSQHGVGNMVASSQLEEAKVSVQRCILGNITIDGGVPEKESQMGARHGIGGQHLSVCVEFFCIVIVKGVMEMISKNATQLPHVVDMAITCKHHGDLFSVYFIIVLVALAVTL